jgi:hypothetical protein
MRGAAVMAQSSRAFLAAVPAPRQQAGTLLTLQRIFRAQVDAKLVPAVLFDTPTALWRHSGEPPADPISAIRSLSASLWSRAIIDARRIFAANAIEATAEILSDHEFIRSCGCESAANLPAVFADETVGTVSLRDIAGCPDRVAKIARLSPFALNALIVARFDRSAPGLAKDDGP